MKRILSKFKFVLAHLFGTKTILVNYVDSQCFMERHGNKFDLKTSVDTIVASGKGYLIPLGVKMTLPEYYAATIIPRSSTFLKYGLLLGNSQGEIEWDYSEVWNFIGYATQNMQIPIYARIAQFDVKPVFDAPWYVKLGFILTPKFKFKKVDSLTTSRSGLGSTGN